MIIIINKLTLYHTILTFNNPKEEGFGTHYGKRRNAGNQHFFLFPTLFSTLSKTEIVILATFNLLSANALNLVVSKILFFGNWFIHEKDLVKMDQCSVDCYKVGLMVESDPDLFCDFVNGSSR